MLFILVSKLKDFYDKNLVIVDSVRRELLRAYITLILTKDLTQTGFCSFNRFDKLLPNCAVFKFIAAV